MKQKDSGHKTDETENQATGRTRRHDGNQRGGYEIETGSKRTTGRIIDL